MSATWKTTSSVTGGLGLRAATRARALGATKKKAATITPMISVLRNFKEAQPYDEIPGRQGLLPAAEALRAASPPPGAGPPPGLLLHAERLEAEFLPANAGLQHQAGLRGGEDRDAVVVPG